jgi:hypothetical protein
MALLSYLWPFLCLIVGTVMGEHTELMSKYKILYTQSLYSRRDTSQKQHQHCHPFIITYALFNPHVDMTHVADEIIKSGCPLKIIFACFQAIFTILVNLVASSFFLIDVTFTSHLCHKSNADATRITIL